MTVRKERASLLLLGPLLCSSLLAPGIRFCVDPRHLGEVPSHPLVLRESVAHDVLDSSGSVFFRTAAPCFQNHIYNSKFTLAPSICLRNPGC